MEKVQKIEKVEMSRGTYYLARDQDQAGDCGAMLRSLDVEGKQVGKNGELYLGCSVQCGSQYARTMQWQDWWLTTPITEFLEISEDGKFVKFRTKNSIYSVLVK